MNKKFKELRMFILCLAMVIIFLGFGLYAYQQASMAQALGLGILTFMAIVLLLFRYKIVLFDDMMMIYEWKVLAMLPVVIQYKDIQSIEKVSKCHVVIHHQKESHVYVFDSQKFIDAYHTLNKVGNDHENG